MRAIKRLVFAAAWLGILFAIFEVGLRIAGFRASRVFPPLEFVAFETGPEALTFLERDPRLFWRLRPSSILPTYASGGFERTTSRGMRGIELPATKDDFEVRVAILGDSCAFGFGIAQRRTMAGAFERRMRAGGRNVSIINAGVPGYTSLQSLRRFERDVLPLEPDIAVFYTGHWNDFGPAVGKPDHEKDASSFAAEPREPFIGIRTLQLVGKWTAPIAERLRARRTAWYREQFEEGQPPDGVRVPLARFRSNLERFVQLARSRGVQPVLLLGPAPEETRRWFPIDEYHEAMRAVALEQRVLVVDPADDLERAGVDDDLFDDWIHPSVVGHRALARRLYHALGHESRSKLYDPTLAAFEAIEDGAGLTRRDLRDACVARLVSDGASTEGESIVAQGERGFEVAPGATLRLDGALESARCEARLRIDSAEVVRIRVGLGESDAILFEGDVDGVKRLQGIELGTFFESDFRILVQNLDAAGGSGIEVSGELVYAD